MNNCDFEVGEKYENEKGNYEVLSMNPNHNEMVIKWEDGKEITTSIKLQWRILERRRIEKAVALAKKNPKSRKSSRPSSFEGFLETDFSGGVAGTTWRTQKSLGGTVTTLLNSDDPPFKSRAVSRMPEIHWIDMSRSDGKALPTKLFVKLDKEFLYYGLYIERSKDKDNKKSDWSHFVTWLSDDKNESWLKEIADEYELHIFNKKGSVKPFDALIKAREGQWHMKKGDEDQSLDSLAGFLKTLPEKGKLDLCIAKTAAKKDTLARGAQIAQDISGLFDILLPLYRASGPPVD